MYRTIFAAARALSLSALAATVFTGQGVLAQSTDNKAPTDLSKTPTLYVATYSHLDTEWCWTYRDSIEEYIPNTLKENFALFEQYPNYTFNWTGATRYKFMKEYYPEEFAKLKEYVAAGRWVPTGSAWEENDAIVPSSESITRSILYSNRWFQKEFGKTSDQYMMPDTFGFPASLPTVLAHSGLKGFSTKKLTYGAGAAVGVPFNVGRWIGPDGQSVIAALNPGDYRTRVTSDLSENKDWLTRLQENGKKSGLFVDYMYHGNGDLGGSPGAESAKWLTQSLAGTGPVRVVAGNADQMFDDIAQFSMSGLPTYQGDLLLIQHSAGSINSGAAMKRWNHRNERLADAAERAAVSANLLGGMTYPTARLTDAWQRFLGGQMHDILPGTSIPAAYEFAWNDQIVALNQFADVAIQGVARVAQEMDTRAQGIPVVVYNPLALEREDVVTADVTFAKAPAQVSVYGPDGKPIPSQIVKKSGNRVTVLFLARMPSVGFAAFDIRPVKAAATPSPLKVSARHIENVRYRVVLDAAGDVASIYDKTAKREMLSAPLRLAFLQEKPKQHPAWNMDWDDRQKPPTGYVDGPAKVTVLENGPVRVALQVEREARGSTFRQIIRLSAGTAGERVEFRTDVDWRTRESSLKAVFPLAVANPMATYNEEVGTIQRGNNDPKKYEVPAHEWFDLTAPDNSYGVSVLNEAKYGSDKPDDNTLRLTLLYTPGVRDRFQHQGTQDFGHHEISYALQGHTGDWRTGRTAQQAARLNQPLQAYRTTAHPGAKARILSLLKIDSPSIVVAAMKKAEDSDEIIIRLYEQNGQPSQNVRLSTATPILKAREVDGQEHPVTTNDAADVKNGALVFDMKPYHPRAFALTFPKVPVPQTLVATAVPLRLPFDTDTASAYKAASDGAFDAEKRSYPAELLPASVESGGVPFNLGTGKNAVTCAGQKITLPPTALGKRWLYILAAADGGDVPATFGFGGTQTGNFPTGTLTIQQWDGYVGQWDTRLWKGEVPPRPSVWENEYAGLTPGFIKMQPIAWYADHRRLADGKNDAYRFCYLFRYALPIPAGATSIVLPKNPRVRIFAVTAAEQPASTSPVAPLYGVY